MIRLAQAPHNIEDYTAKKMLSSVNEAGTIEHDNYHGYAGSRHTGLSIHIEGTEVPNGGVQSALTYQQKNNINTIDATIEGHPTQKIKSGQNLRIFEHMSADGDTSEQ